MDFHLDAELTAEFESHESLDMKNLRCNSCWNHRLRGFRKFAIIRCMVQLVMLLLVMSACETEPNSSTWEDKNALTISLYLKKNKQEYSKFYRILEEGKMLNTLYAYNPNGDNYTLFLPTDEAVDRFMVKLSNYSSFEALLKDTSFIKKLTRYHTLNSQVHTSEFPDGALTERTLTGERLVTSFFEASNNQLIKINNAVPVVKSNLEMTNGYIHVISEVLQPVDLSGYDWLQQQNGYSIFAKIMVLSGIKNKLTWSKYTFFAEPDSIYRSYGINKAEDLVSLISTPGFPLTSTSNRFYQFAAYHILNGEYYMNDLSYGSRNYSTLSGHALTITVGMAIKINPGADTYGKILSKTGEETVIDYIRPIPEVCNILTRTGPVNSITDLMYYEDLPLPPKMK